MTRRRGTDEDTLGPDPELGEERGQRHGWRIVYRVRDPRTGRDIECRLAAFSRGAGPGWLRMATDAELRPGAPIELELILRNSQNGPRDPSCCTIARGKITDVRPNAAGGEPAYLVKVSIDAVDRGEAAA